MGRHGCEGIWSDYGETIRWDCHGFFYLNNNKYLLLINLAIQIHGNRSERLLGFLQTSCY